MSMSECRICDKYTRMRNKALKYFRKDITNSLKCNTKGVIH